MRLLFLSNYYPPYHIGGYEELCANVANGLQARGHAVSVLTSQHGINGAGTAIDGIFRLLYPEVDSRPFGPTLNFFLGRPSRLRANLTSLERTVKEIQPDILMVWGMWNLPRQLLALAESWGRPSVVYYVADYGLTLPDAYTLHWREPARRWYTRLPKRLIGLVALGMLRHQAQPGLRFKNVVCVSRAVRDCLREKELALEYTQVIYNGIDTRIFSRPTPTRFHSSDSLSLLYAGRLSPEKGVHTAIEAVGILARQGRCVHLVLNGKVSPEYLANLRRIAVQAGVLGQIEFRNHIPREQMPQVLEQFDVLLVPSIWAEPMPRIVQEGMAAGLVVIGARVGGIPEIISDDVNGLLFSPEDSVGLARQIERLLDDRILCRRLSEAGRAIVRERFDINRMINEIEEYLQRVNTGS